MVLLKQDGIAADSWTRIDDDAEIAPGNTGVTQPIISLTRWKRDRDTLLALNGEIGIVLGSDESPALIADDIHRFGVICLNFPKFTDGRGYSYARLLRSRYNYTSEIRAIGNVLRDQALFMRRCGIDALEIMDGRSTDGWRQAFAEFSIRYQPAEDTPTIKIAKPGQAHYLNSEVVGCWAY
jgi:uncharacterized protein (DUF934 family)